MMGRALLLILIVWIGIADTEARERPGSGVFAAAGIDSPATSHKHTPHPNPWVEYFTLPDLADRAEGFSLAQLGSTVGNVALTEYPVYSVEYTSWQTKSASFWTSGFFPGCLWLAFEATGNADYQTWAEAWTQGLENQKFNTSTHDVGFIIFNSFGIGYRLTGSPAYRDVVLEAAASLATRFDEDVGCIRSWDWGAWQFPVIIDNMMNIELLFWASKNGGQAAWYDMAVSHAMTTLEHHVRADGSTFHVVDYDAETGDVLAKSTWQGFTTDSTWARGQAWAIYGFVMSFRETGDTVFLDAAVDTANFYLERLPKDHVPFWDFDAPGIPDTERDTSAAAIVASALFELGALHPDPATAKRFERAAKKILRSLCMTDAKDGYLALGAGGAPLSPGLLMHGCYHHPDCFAGGSVCDESLIWGDYYFLEALVRYKALGD